MRFNSAKSFKPRLVGIKNRRIAMIRKFSARFKTDNSYA